MNIHTPERDADESFQQYKDRRKLSKILVDQKTHPEDRIRKPAKFQYIPDIVRKLLGMPSNEQISRS